MMAMKKFMMILAMAQMMIWSCVKPEIDTPVTENINPEDVVFTAVTEATKAAPAAGGVVSWTMEDEIGVYDGTNYVKATVLSADGNKITFSASVNASASEYIAVSPYEAALTDNGAFTSVDGKVKIATSAVQTAGKQVISIASVSSAAESFVFRNVGNLLRFKVNKAAVKKVKITGANGEKIAGAVSVDPATGVATGELSATEIVVDVTPGVDNFIALAPGVSLPKGFVITLYGSEMNEAGYEGEVASAGALTLGRNQMINLGLIDGWIDNYKLWQAGKPITIAGVEYTKESTGFSGTYLPANTADINMYDYLYGKKGAFFLETSSGYKYTSSTFINFGKTNEEMDVLLISRYDNAPVIFNPGQRFSLVRGNVYMKGIEFDLSTSGANYMFVTNGYVYGNLHIDHCKITLHSGDNFLYCNGTGQLGAKSVRVVNSKIKSTHTARIAFVSVSSSFKQLDNIKEFTIENNVFYNENADGAISLIEGTMNQPSSGNNQETAVKIVGNTFFNMRGTNTYLSNYSLASLDITDNIFYSQTSNVTGEYSHMIKSVNAEVEYPYTIDRNISNLSKLYWFNPYQAGAYKELGKFVDRTDANFFETADAVNGIFIPTEAYASYGAKQ